MITRSPQPMIWIVWPCQVGCDRVHKLMSPFEFDNCRKLKLKFRRHRIYFKGQSLPFTQKFQQKILYCGPKKPRNQFLLLRIFKKVQLRANDWDNWNRKYSFSSSINRLLGVAPMHLTSLLTLSTYSSQFGSDKTIMYASVCASTRLYARY